MSNVYTQLAVDIFRRANENPLDPTKWTQTTKPGQPQLAVSSDLCVAASGSGYGAELYTGVALPPDQYVEATIGPSFSGGGIILGFARSTSAMSGGLAYLFSVNAAGGSPFCTIEQIYFNSGFWVPKIIASNFSIPISIGDVWRLEVTGAVPTLTLKQNGIVILQATADPTNGFGTSNLPTPNITSGSAGLGIGQTGDSVPVFACGAIEPALTITTSSLPLAPPNVAYSQSLAATGGYGAYTWSLASGTLPTGLSLSSAGAISGTPTVLGTYSFVVQVQDTNSPIDTTTQSLSILVSTLPPYDPTKVFLGSMSETSDDSLGTQYIGHVIVIASAPAGLANPYLGKIKKVASAPGGSIGDPFLGQVVIVSDAPTGGDPYLGHVKET